MALRTLPKFPCIIISLYVPAGRDVNYSKLCVNLRIVHCAALGYFFPWPVDTDLTRVQCYAALFLKIPSADLQSPVCAAASF